MKFINNLTFYEDCKAALIECYGEADLAAEYLKNSKYPNITSYNLLESITLIKEGLGGRILNSLSKHLGGDVSKIDHILQKMNKTENDFVDRENKIETEYTQLFREFVKIKFGPGDKSKMGPIQLRLQELELQMKGIIKAYNSIMDDLEKEVDILTKGSNRKSDYYNLKRSKDSAESKRKRAENKYKLSKYQDDPNVSQGLSNVFIGANQAQQIAANAQSQVSSIQAKVTKYDPGPEWKSIVFKESEAKMRDAHVVSTKYKNSIYDMIKNEELNPAPSKSEYSKAESSFVAKKSTALKRIESKINVVASLAPDGSSDQIKDAVKYYTTELEKIKSELETYKFPAYMGIVKKKKKKKVAVNKVP